MQKEEVEWLKWEELKEWGEIECPMFDNEKVMTYYNPNFPCHDSYTAPFGKKDGTVGYYRYDHDEGKWEAWLYVLEVFRDE